MQWSDTPTTVAVKVPTLITIRPLYDIKPPQSIQFIKISFLNELDIKLKIKF